MLKTEVGGVKPAFIKTCLETSVLLISLLIHTANTLTTIIQNRIERKIEEVLTVPSLGSDEEEGRVKRY